jgi:hypothetical protein
MENRNFAASKVSNALAAKGIAVLSRREQGAGRVG